MKGEDTDRDTFIARAERELDMVGYTQLVNAYQLAKAFHRNQDRKSGERYFTHPRAVAEILLDFGPSSHEEVVTALLHDVVEDQYILPDFLRQAFGEKIARGVVTLTKYTVRLREHGRIEKVEIPTELYYRTIAQAEYFIRRGKMGDRLHNLRTMLALPSASKRNKVAETRQWILPFAYTTDERLAKAIDDQCSIVEASCM